MSGRRMWSALVLAVAVTAAPFVFFESASASTSQIGVYVEPTTTLPPPPPRPTPVPTTAPPPPPPAATPTTVVSPKPTPVTTVPAPTPAPTAGSGDALAAPLTDAGDGVGIFDLPRLVAPIKQEFADKGVVGSVKSVATAAKKTVSEVLKGKPVADVMEEVLPESAAAVVVPAVRTASTFAFPIGLAAAVFGFLGIQQRIDSADPKLAAAPMAHDDDLVNFE